MSTYAHCSAGIRGVRLFKDSFSNSMPLLPLTSAWPCMDVHLPEDKYPVSHLHSSVYELHCDGHLQAVAYETRFVGGKEG